MMLKPPIFAPFRFGTVFSPFALVSLGEVVQSLTNVQKLSLGSATPVGTRVQVTDGFVMSGESDPLTNGFFYPSGTQNGKPQYFNVEGLANGYDPIHYSGTAWRSAGGSEAALGSEDFPWQASWTLVGLILTHPAVQELTVPSTAQGGMFVSGGTQDGVWVKDVESTSDDGKDSYTILGQSVGGDYSLFWSAFLAKWNLISAGDDVYYSLSDVATPDLSGSDKFVMAVSSVAYSKRGTFNGKSYYNKIGSATSTSLSAIFWSSATWHITNAIGVDLDTSTSDVATPDLATFLLATVVTNVAWLNASDDSPASITVMSITQGELDAGVTVAGAGTATSNGAFVNRSTVVFARPSYGRLADPATIIQANDINDVDNINDNGLGGDPSYSTTEPGLRAPWLGTWITASGVIPTPTVTRNDVASEANWEIVS